MFVRLVALRMGAVCVGAAFARTVKLLLQAIAPSEFPSWGVMHPCQTSVALSCCATIIFV